MNHGLVHRSLWGLLVAISLMVAACGQAPLTSTQPALAASPELQPTATQARPSAIAPAAPAPARLYLPEYLPAALRQNLTAVPGWEIAAQPETAGLQVQTGSEETIAQWVYALAAPFNTISDEAALEDLISVWQKGPQPPFPAQQILVDQSTAAIFETLWGRPSGAVVALDEAQLLQQAWQRADAWAILPFEQLEPRWKVIAIDGASPLHKDFDAAHYGLTVSFSLAGDAAQAAQWRTGAAGLPWSNRRPEKLTTVVLTGVTALVRATAWLMETKGMTYPAQDITPWLRQADILHINNEIPFSPRCPRPFDRENNLVFCSRPEYIELLEDIGTDVIELSGDHFRDWGPDAMLYTLDLYRQHGLPYYGGGRNLAEALTPARFEHNGNKIAFLGCNAKPPGYSSAAENQPGAVHCDFEIMKKLIAEVRAQGYQPIVTFQHLEYYDYKANPILVADFRAMAEAGAVIVSGSQAHQPHAIEFDGQSFLHYGLGNLFFDQYLEGEPNRQAFLDRHVFYDGRYISTELLTIHFVDLARARPMTPQERSDLLETVFKAGGW